MTNYTCYLDYDSAYARAEVDAAMLEEQAFYFNIEHPDWEQSVDLAAEREEMAFLDAIRFA